MSTNALIGIEDSKGSVKAIYTHFDGYPKHHGPVLLHSYSTAGEIKELMKLGDLSVLEDTLEGCIAYGRDWGEKNTGAVIYDSIDDFLEDDMYFKYLYRTKTSTWYLYEDSYKKILKKVV